MFYLEWKRSIHNKTFFYLMMVTIVAFIMGWALPFGLEHIVAIEFEYYLFSTYTVFTQFGYLLFGFVTAYFFNKDYKDRNMIFYKNFEVGILKYYCMKITVLLIEEMACIGLALLIVGILFKNFEYYIFCFCLYSAVVLQYFLIVGVVSLIFKSLLMELGISIIYWISSIILISFGGIGKYFAAFDASNSLYSHVENYFSQGITIPTMEFINPMMEYIILIFIVVLVVCSLAKEWIRKGI